MSRFLVVAMCVLSLACPRPLTAQAGKVPEQLLKEQGELWISPLRIHGGDAKWLLPLGAGTALLLESDRRIFRSAEHETGLLSPSRTVSNLGDTLSLALASGTIYGIGKFTGHSKVAHTGLLAGDAVLQSGALAAGLKFAFNRERPDKTSGRGDFWDGGQSFPSGHAMASFAFASVVVHQYPHKHLLAVGAYGMASAIALSRIGDLNHFPSDVFVGAAIGELVGRFIVHRHAEDLAP